MNTLEEMQLHHREGTLGKNFDDHALSLERILFHIGVFPDEKRYQNVLNLFNLIRQHTEHAIEQGKSPKEAPFSSDVDISAEEVEIYQRAMKILTKIGEKQAIHDKERKAAAIARELLLEEKLLKEASWCQIA